MVAAEATWQVPEPAVYLDQWVWIRLSRAARGRPERPEDVDVLSAVRDAARAGVVFPLSATHYEETLRILDPRQRDALVAVMAPISSVRTIRRHSDLVRHQILVALHETVGRPAFRPAQLQVLGLGVSWAFRGVEAHLQVRGPDDAVLDVDKGWLRHANQYFEALQLAGPGDDDLPDLRRDGYRSPREIEDAPGSRLAWEALLAERLAARRTKPDELRRLMLARELSHEYLDLLNAILAEYRLTLNDIAGSVDPATAQRRMVEFAERIPTMRIAAEIKTLLFRNPHRKWSHNMVRDIDAVSVAIPYCRVAVIDRDAADLARRVGAGVRHGTTVISDLNALPPLLEELRGGPPPGRPQEGAAWDAIGPGQGFALTWPPRLTGADLPAGSTVRLSDPDGASSVSRISELAPDE
ncbi:hypothetical protein ASE38_00260 [Cellulomonas sp. Root930]|nr:hypothetical protein ASE38_00260 [Cellulomonas sp. Root930]